MCDSKPLLNQQFTSHVGYSNAQCLDTIQVFFSPQTVQFISSKVTELLMDFYAGGIVVPDDKIIHVMNDVYTSYRPSTGDIFTRYIMTSNENTNSLDELINQVVSIIVTDVKANLTIENKNARLDPWVVLYGSFNKQGLNQTSPITTRDNKPPSALFNMNY